MPLRFATAWWSIGAVLVVIDIVFSLKPPGDERALLPDKLVHFVSYFLLSFWFVSLTMRRRVLAFAGVVALGGVLELLQGLTPARQPEMLDLLANSAGAALAMTLVIILPVNLFAVAERRLLCVAQ